MKASGEGRELIVEGSEKIVFKTFSWERSGYAKPINMEWSVNGALNPNEEKQAADYPKIRHIKVPKIPSIPMSGTSSLAGMFSVYRGRLHRGGVLFRPRPFWKNSASPSVW